MAPLEIPSQRSDMIALSPWPGGRTTERTIGESAANLPESELVSPSIHYYATSNP